MIVIGINRVWIGVAAEEVVALHNVGGQVRVSRLHAVIQNRDADARAAVSLAAIPRLIGIHVGVRKCQGLAGVPQVPLASEGSVVGNHELLDLLSHVRLGPDDLRALQQGMAHLEGIEILRLSQPKHVDVFSGAERINQLQAIRGRQVCLARIKRPLQMHRHLIVQEMALAVGGVRINGIGVFDVGVLVQ